jgi:sugar lactone lactonase YvrE
LSFDKVFGIGAESDRPSVNTTMNTLKLTLHLALVAGFSFTLSPSLHAGLKSSQPALSVLGKPDFGNTTANGPTANELGRAEGVAIDPNTSKVFVADATNHRILRFGATAAYQTGAAAEAVFGQADFISGLANRGGAVAANTLNTPRSLFVDAAGRLWVADASNHRVLRFDNASSKASGSNADAVLGQANFATTATATTQSGMSSPVGVTTDASGNLFVTDRTNHRVLIFYNAASKGNGANADRVLGQATFVTSAIGTTASAFNFPWGVSVDGGGRLWVGDTANNRVLRFDGAATIGNGGAASGVLGQADFVSSAVLPVGANALNSPFYLAAAPDGTLWVGDFSHERYLGQPDFVTEGAAAASATGVNGANSVAIDKEGGLFASDFNYNRILRYSGVVKVKAPAKVTAVGGKAIFRGTSEHASVVRFKQPGAPFSDTKGNVTNWKAKVTGLSRPITRVRVQSVALDGRKATKVVKVLNP